MPTPLSRSAALALAVAMLALPSFAQPPAAEPEPPPSPFRAERKDPEAAVAKRFAPPPEAVKLTKKGRLWADKKRQQVIIDGYVALQRGMLEMFACPAGTKEHESVVALFARSRDVHTALLAIGAQKGTTVQWNPKYVPATGQSIRVWVMWFDEQGKLQKSDARKWIAKTGTEETLQQDWVFAGSNFWTDPADGVTYYEADAGDMICVSNFASAMLDLPIVSSKDTGSLQFAAFTKNVPPERTFVRVVLRPIPFPSDDPQPTSQEVADPDEPPADEILKLRGGDKPRGDAPEPASAAPAKSNPAGEGPKPDGDQGAPGADPSTSRNPGP